MSTKKLQIVGSLIDDKYATMYVNEEEGAELPDGYDIYIDTTDLTTKIPIIPGVIYATASSLLPEGFLWCNGAEVSRTEYSELFSAIGTAYGAGDGSTTFNVPDLQTRIPMGAGGEFGLGSMGGEAEHALVAEEMPSHKHDHLYISANSEFEVTYINAAQSEGSAAAIATNGNTPIYTSSTGNDQPHNNLQPYTVVNYIISTGKGAMISAVDVVAGIQTLPLAVEYGGTGENNLTSLGEALNATGTVGAFTYEEVSF